MSTGLRRRSPIVSILWLVSGTFLTLLAVAMAVVGFVDWFADYATASPEELAFRTLTSSLPLVLGMIAIGIGTARIVISSSACHGKV